MATTTEKISPDELVDLVRSAHIEAINVLRAVMEADPQQVLGSVGNEAAQSAAAVQQVRANSAMFVLSNLDVAHEVQDGPEDQGGGEQSWTELNALSDEQLQGLGLTAQQIEEVRAEAQARAAEEEVPQGPPPGAQGPALGGAS